MAAAIHIHAPRPVEVLRRIHRCPTCERRRRFVALVYEWYEATWTCCGCGDAWTDGERHERPFLRGWRAKPIAKAKRAWAESLKEGE